MKNALLTALTAVWRFLVLGWKNRTKVLGYTQVLIAFLATADQALVTAVIGPNGLKWLLLISGGLAALIGHHNSYQQKKAAAQATVTAQAVSSFKQSGNTLVLLLVALAVLGATYTGAYFHGRKDGGNAVKAQQLEDLGKANAEVKRLDKAYGDKSKELAAADATIAKLLAYQPEPQALIKRIPADEPTTPGEKPTCADRSDDYWLQYNAIASGLPDPGPPATTVVPPASDVPAAVQAPGLVETGHPRGQGGPRAELQGDRRGHDPRAGPAPGRL